MKVRLAGLLALCCAFGLIVSFSHSDATQSQTTQARNGLSQDERDLINEINEVRAHPDVYAGYLEKLKPFFKGKDFKSGTLEVTTREGWTAVEDAIAFLRVAKPLGPLGMSAGLSLASMSHVKDQSGTGATGHKGNDSSLVEQRVKPFGTWEGGIGENVGYGPESARDRLLTWLIDDGFASRGHRRRIMSADYKVAGICCGPHPEYGTMCVLTLAGSFVDATAAKAPAGNQPNSNSATSPKNGSTLSAASQTQVNATNNSSAAKPSTSGGAANANSNKSKAPPKTRKF